MEMMAWNQQKYYNEHNRGLFWYGIFANLKQAFGKMLLFVGFILAVFVGLFASAALAVVILIVFCGLGFWMIATGSSQRFDYQRQSGNIIHKGDW
jgi:hypothetical protein